MKKVAVCESGYNMFYGAQQSLYNFLINSKNPDLHLKVVTPGEGLFTEQLNEAKILRDVVTYPKALDKSGSDIKSKGLVGKIKSIISLPLYIIKYYKYFKREDYNLIYCNDIRSILTCGVAAKMLGIPVLWYVRIDKNLGIFNQIAANIADQIIVIADNVKDIFNTKYIINSSNKFKTIYTGIDMEMVDSVIKDDSIRRELNLDSNIKLVGIVASVQPRKGQRDLVQAVIEMQKNKGISNHRFLIIGDTLNPSDNKYLEEIKSMIKDNNLEDYFFFLGWRKNVLNIMKQLDLLVLPSYSEGLPRTILESLACGCPAVATDVAGTGEIIEDGVNGKLIPPGNITKLSNALEYMLVDENRLKEMGNQGIKTIKNKFLMEKYIHNLEEVMINKAK
ncbi:glycosyltransferase [Alteribacter natronophilus]|uniref:glycosyltransferase n=1 Tax=Alteribacter natronophilus TaxID=2583810 RepID=UPI00110F59D7|nr:glycosyltransferase [Alteribacter natronophilus]TMW72245.1 glycosyltransferase family 4 protein [Alteribacter natronophilus]